MALIATRFSSVLRGTTPTTRTRFCYMVSLPACVKAEIRRRGAEKTDYRNPAFPDSPRLGRKNCNLLILLLLFYG